MQSAWSNVVLRMRMKLSEFPLVSNSDQPPSELKFIDKRAIENCTSLSLWQMALFSNFHVAHYFQVSTDIPSSHQVFHPTTSPVGPPRAPGATPGPPPLAVAAAAAAPPTPSQTLLPARRARGAALPRGRRPASRTEADAGQKGIPWSGCV